MMIAVRSVCVGSEGISISYVRPFNRNLEIIQPNDSITAAVYLRKIARTFLNPNPNPLRSKLELMQNNPHLHINAQTNGYGFSIFKKNVGEIYVSLQRTQCSLDLDLLRVHINWTF